MAVLDRERRLQDTVEAHGDLFPQLLFLLAAPLLLDRTLTQMPTTLRSRYLMTQMTPSLQLLQMPARPSNPSNHTTLSLHSRRSMPQKATRRMSYTTDQRQLGGKIEEAQGRPR